jgi:hypothetical protein
MITSYKLGWYMVVFLDVLGQSSKLQKLEHLPTNEDEKNTAFQILNDTAGSIVRLRSFFDGIFYAYNQKEDLLNNLSLESRSLTETMLQSKITRHGISDSYIITAPLTEDNKIGKSGVILNLWSAIMATCGSFIMALSAKSAIRGGIDIGPGTVLSIDNNDEVFGPSVVSAVNLESRVAQYPRIVVGERLWQYLSEADEWPVYCKYDSVAKNFAAACKSLIFQDYDGIHTLDCFGIPRYLEGAIEPQLVGKAYNWVVQEHKKYINSKDFKLAGKYSLLRQYIESRLDMWKITIIK